MTRRISSLLGTTTLFGSILSSKQLALQHTPTLPLYPLLDLAAFKSEMWRWLGAARRWMQKRPRSGWDRRWDAC